MSNLTVKFYSNCLIRRVSFDMIIPNDPRQPVPDSDKDYASRPMKTLFLLHGYTGDAGNWVPEWLIQKYNFAVVIPNGENSFWLDGLSTGHRFGSFVGEELVQYVRKTFGLAQKKEDTGILGLSMGGFGALRTALKYPDTFGMAGAMSSALIQHEVSQMKPGSGNGVANYDYYRECFGEPENVLQSDSNPEYLAEQIQQSGGTFPRMYLCCGTEDFLLNENRTMHSFLTARNIPHAYHESKGSHDPVFWDEYTQKIIPWMFG